MRTLSSINFFDWMIDWSKYLISLKLVLIPESAHQTKYIDWMIDWLKYLISLKLILIPESAHLTEYIENKNLFQQNFYIKPWL